MTDAKNEIEREFEALGLRKGGILFPDPHIAVEMVKRCRERNVPILGIDAFRLSEGKTQPVMDESVDYATGSDPASRTSDRWSHAETFLREGAHSGLHFEIVCG
ncbi:MAG: hypothetical protein R3F54_14645 [Alphaproteobacteria bacterium]